MIPDFDITAEDVSITESIKSSLISLHITDESGTMSDEAEICLDYSSYFEASGKLKISLGYKETGVLPMGVYIANEVTIQSPPQTLRIKCHAANLKKSLKEQVSKEWHQVALDSLVTEIAQKHGYGAKIAEEFKDIFIPHIDQTNESDMNFLTKLGQSYGAISKPAGGYLLFVPKGKSKQQIGTTLLTPKDVLNWKVNFNVRSRYGSVIANWHDYNRGETIQEKVGDKSPSYTLPEVYSNVESAISAASTKLKQLKRSTVTLNITTVGDPELCAEAKISLSGFCQEIDGEWVVNKVEHILDNRGYQTIIEAVISKVIRENLSK